MDTLLFFKRKKIIISDLKIGYLYKLTWFRHIIDVLVVWTCSLSSNSFVCMKPSLLFNNSGDSDWISIWWDWILNVFGGVIVVQVDINKGGSSSRHKLLPILIQTISYSGSNKLGLEDHFPRPIMSGITRRIFIFQRQLSTLAHDVPTDTLKRKIARMEKIRKRRDPKKDQFFVEVPEGEKYLDTATWPMTLTAVGVAIFAKLLMMV